MPKEKDATPRTPPPSSSVYPGSTEYAVLMNRFKLLNLVQRVAHRDVMEMIDTVGLEVLAYKGGARQRWMGANASQSDEESVSYDKSRSVDGAAARRGRHGRGRAEATAHRVQTTRPAGATTTPPRAARLTRAQEQQLLRRLTQPRRSPGPSTPRPLTPREQHWRRGAYAQASGSSSDISDNDRYSSDFSDEATSVRPTAATLARELLRPAAGATSTSTADVQPLPPAPALRGRGGTLAAASTRAGAAASAAGRTLPLEAIQHAAATLLARQRQPQEQQQPPYIAVSREEHVPRPEVLRGDRAEALVRPSLTAQETTMPPSQQRLPGPARVQAAGRTSQAGGGAMAAVAAVPSSTQTSPPPPAQMLLPRQQHQQPPPGPPPTLHELSTAIDAMLDDHMRILQELVHQPDSGGSNEAAAAMGAAYGPQGGAAAESGEQQPCVEVEMTTTDAEEEEKLDEALLLSRLHEKVAHMDDAMVQIAQRSQVTADVPAAAVAKPDSQTVAAQEDGKEGQAGVMARRTARRRGTMPAVVVQRLMAHRIENYEYIAHNERLWNTSSTSQFVFAQRLTNALFEDCLDEVLAEVSSIMDNYVDGLAEHELQQ